MTRRLRCSLLCEDIGQENFFRPILEKSLGRVNVEARRPGVAGGAPFVMARLADLVGKLRRTAREATGLVVVIDGDTFGLAQRLGEINAVLSRHSLPKLDPAERIAVCVPCRNIETWEMWLCGFDDVDERRDLKKQWVATGYRAKEAAKAWFNFQTQDRRDAESLRLPALAHGREQIKRLQELAGA